MYNVPVSYYGNTMQMRVKKDYPSADSEGHAVQTPFEVQGFWNQMDSHTGLPGRDVYPLSEAEGDKIGLYRVVYGRELNKAADYIRAKEYTVTKEMRITSENLPSGDYLMRYVIEDMFGNIHYSKGFIPVKWDGKRVTYLQK